jgi:hypothetical protein
MKQETANAFGIFTLTKIDSRKSCEIFTRKSKNSNARTSFGWRRGVSPE